MQSDLPHTLYLKTDKDGKVIQKVSSDDKALRLQEEANRKAAERRLNAKKDEYTLDEIFKQ